MTARDEAERAISDVLAGHRSFGWFNCSCGKFESDGLDYRAHVASVLADLMDERQAEAWDEGARCAGSYGHEDDWTHDMTPLTENPYRPDPKDTRDE